MVRMNFSKAKKELIRKIKTKGIYSGCPFGIAKKGKNYYPIIAALPNYDPILNGYDNCVLISDDGWNSDSVKSAKGIRKNQMR